MFERIYYGVLGLYFRPRTYRESLCSFDKSRPFLIVGLPRSGTSILYSVLNEFDEFYVSYEALCEPFLFEKNKFRLTYFYYEVLRQAGHSNQALGGDGVLVKKNLYEHVYKCLGNKTIFRESRLYKYKLNSLIDSGDVDVVFISRDPLDRLSSILSWKSKRDILFRNTIEVEKNIEDLVDDELRKSTAFIEFSKRVEGLDNVLCVEYENLVSNASTLGEIAAFLGGAESEKNADLRGKSIFSDSVGSWRKRLSPSIIELIETKSGMLSPYDKDNR